MVPLQPPSRSACSDTLITESQDAASTFLLIDEGNAMSRASDHLARELAYLIDRFRMEYKLTYAEAVGVLELVKSDLIEEARKSV